MVPVRDKINSYLLRGACSGNKRLVGLCTELPDHRDEPWAFVDHKGIAPTDNTAEQALHHAVIWRNMSFGTHSMHGSLFVERMLTVIETCRLQKRSVFSYVTEAIEVHVAKQPIPSLLPGA